MIYLMAFLMSITTGLMIVSNPLLAIEKFNASTMALGALGTAAATTYALGCLLFGHLADRLGFKKMIRASCWLLLAAFLLIFAVRRLEHLFGLVIISSVGGALFWPSVMRRVGEEEKRDLLHARIGNFNIAVQAGVMLGPLIGGRIFPLNYRLPYLLSALIFLFFQALLFRRGGQTAKLPGIPEREPVEEVTDQPVPGFIGIGWLANFASWFAIGSSQTLFPKLALALGIREAVLGTLLSLIPLGQLSIFALLRKSHRWHYNFTWLLLSQFAGMAGLALLSLTSQTTFWGAAFLLIGLCGGMTYFSSLFYSLYRQEGKGRKSGLHESFLGFGTGLGPLLAGIAARLGTLRSPYYLCIAVFLLSIGVQAAILARVKSLRPIFP